MTNAELRAIVPPFEEAGKPTHIYGLLDPETGELRYIGKSVRPVERLANHCNEPPSNCHRSHWIQSLKARGLRPELVILESVYGEWPWAESERFWIAYARAHGCRLTNNTSGGDGVRGLPAEARARMAATWRGRKHRPESLEKMRAASSGRKASPETRAKMSAAQRGRQITWTDKISEGNRKLGESTAAMVKLRIDAGDRVIDIAREFGLHRTTVSKIKKGTYR